MWTTDGGRMLLTQGAHPVLLARVAPDHGHVRYLRTDLFRSPVPPITAAESRRRPPSHVEGWAERFRAQLVDGVAGPLRDSAWGMCPADVAVPAFRASGGRDPYGPDAVATGVRGELDWFGTRVQLLPLHQVPEPDAARVKAYRKLARAGRLPPVLTWWISGLQCPVVLDGLARLAAAWAERIPATVLALLELDPERVDHGVDRAVTSYEARTTGVRLTGEPADRVHARFSKQLADDLDTASRSGITRAWPLLGGVAAWEATAQAHGW